MKNGKWIQTEIPELSYRYIAGFRVERLVTQKGIRFSIGPMVDALITFESETMLYKFLTV